MSDHDPQPRWIFWSTLADDVLKATKAMHPEARIPETAMAAPTSDLYRYSVEAALKKEREKIAGLRQSLEALKNQDGDYADAHRRLLAMHEEIMTVILRHLP